MDKKLRAYDLISGQRARNYRKRLAGFAEGKRSTVVTTKFKLEIQKNMLPSFADCRRAYDTVEGVDKGSLTYFLFTVILSGFRIFSSAAEATVFAQRNLFDDEAFKKAVCSVFNGDIPGFRPASIIKRLATGVRSSGGKNNKYSQEVICAEYKKSLAQKKERTVDQDQVDRVFGDIAKVLLQFESWNNLQKSIPKACEAIDEVLSNYGKFPSLAEMQQRTVVVLPKSSTLAFDCDAPIFNPKHEHLPYAVVASIMSHYNESEGAIDKFVQKHLTTKTQSGLSWLFAGGLKYFCSKTAEDIASDYGVPVDKIYLVKRIKVAAEAINDQEFLGNGKSTLSYAVYRRSVGGRLDSWVANYVKRLQELKKIFDEMSDNLSIPQVFFANGKDFLDTTDCKRSELQVLCRAISESRTGARSAVSMLLGNARTDEDVEKSVKAVLECSDSLNRLHAIKNQLSNAMEQAKKDKNSEWVNIAQDAKVEFDQWGQLKKLPKLNGMTGGVPQAEEELQECVKKYYEVQEARQQYLQRLNTWVQQNGSKPSVVVSQERLEQQRLNNRNVSVRCSTSAPELAIRYLLDRVGKLVRNRKDQCARSVIKWFDEKSIFKNHRDYNTYFCNCLGSLYISPFVQKRHGGYELSQTVVPNRECLWNSFAKYVHELNYEPFTEEAETLLRLLLFVQGREISAIDKTIPADVATLNLAPRYQDAISESLKLELKQTEGVCSSTVAKALNVFASLLSGFAIVLRRNQFYLRTKFVWVKNNVLFYVPKDKEWAIPERYEKSRMFEKEMLVRTDSGKVDVLKTFLNVVKRNKVDERNIGEFLRQLPHDWCYAMPFKLENVETDVTDVLKVAKDGSSGMKISVKKENRHNLVRLIGPSSFKTRLDSLLVSKELVVGDMTVLIDQPIQQELSGADVNLTYGAPVVTLAIPFQKSITPVNKDEPMPFTRIVAIDQGEVGLAYAVFNLSDYGKLDANPIAVGTIAIRSIRRLIRGVKKYRKGRQTRQKFNQKFDSTMFTIRENVAGDVCGVIEGLMNRFHAFPILEREVKNLASGSKQLSLVYKMVNARFLYSNVEMQNNERRAWWYGSDRWSMPGFWRDVRDTVEGEKNTQKVNGRTCKQLHIFPGASVPAYMTSRICSHCGRNVFDLLSEAKESGVKQLCVGQGGEVALDKETLRLYRRPDKDATKEAARRNERADWTQPLRPGEIKLEDLNKQVRENMRRAPKSKQSKDTTQSRYFCVFKDCDWNRVGYHADMNAAINIGRRFLMSIQYKTPKESDGE